MKRLQESSPSSGGIPKTKKVKTSGSSMAQEAEDGSWTKVEKRKQKKAKKAEVKLDVCVFSSHLFEGG
jgi:RNA exonuclease 1